MDAYRIGVSIVLANGVSPILAIIGKDLLHLKTSVGAIEQNFGGWARALAGVGSILAGSAILGGIAKITEKASGFNDELLKMQRLGGDIGKAAAKGEITDKAFDIAKRTGLNVTDAMKIPGSMYSIMGEEEAMATWEPLAKYAMLLQSDKHFKGDVTGELMKLIRAGEITGRITDPGSKNITKEKLDSFLDLASKINAATHGMVGPDALLGMAQQGGGALRGLSDEGFMTMAVQAQAMGGHRAGTAYLSLWQQLAGGTMLKRTAEGLEQYGFIKPDEWTSEGGHVSIGDKAKKRLLGNIATDPLIFSQNIAKELEKRGIHDPAEQMQAVMNITGRQTTQRFTAEEVANLNQIMAERKRMGMGMDWQQAVKLMEDNSISWNMAKLSNAWDTFTVALGGPNSKNFISALQAMTGILNQMTDALRGIDPDTLSSIYKGIAYFAVGLMGIGGLILLSMLGLPAIIAASIAAIVMMAFTDENFSKWLKADSISQWLNQMIIDPVTAWWNNTVATWAGSDSISQWLNRMIVDPITAWLASTSISEKIGAMFSGIGNALSGFVDMITALYDRIKGFVVPNQPGAQKFKDELKDANKSFTPIRFSPGTQQERSQQASFSLNVDGRSLAQSVVDHLESIYGNASGAAAPDGFHSPFGVDHQYNT